MELFKTVLDFVQSIGWELIAAIFILSFRTHIGNLISRLKEAKLPGDTELTFSDTLEPDVEVAGATLENDKIGNIYWLGADLVLVMAAILSGGSRSYIQHGFRQIFHHLESVKLGEKDLEDRLKIIHKEVEDALKSDWTMDNRLMFVNDLESLKTKIGHYIASAQQDFEPYAKEE